MRGLRLLPLVLGSAALSACSLARTLPENHYYTLAVPGAPAGRLGGAVRVAEFTIDEPYRTERIAYRSSPYRLDYYSYHRWAGDPRNLVATAARDYLEQAAGEGAPLEIRGHIRRIEERDDRDGRRGTLAIDLRVQEGAGTVLDRSYDETEPASERSPEAVAEALSRALGKILDRMIADVARAPNR